MPAPERPLLTRRSSRIGAAARLRRRRHRELTGRFLVEGPQSVREALAAAGAVTDRGSAVAAERSGAVTGSGGPGPDEHPSPVGRSWWTGAVRELFATPDAERRHPDLLAAAARAGVPVWAAGDDALAALTETVSPQGVVAVCDRRQTSLAGWLAPPTARPGLVAVLVGIRDPGNAGTVLRTADAAGADAVVFTGEAVDPYNGKCVRASAGSLFHLPLVREPDPRAVVTRLRAAGLAVLAATGTGETDLDRLWDAGGLTGPTAWLFGSEAHGLPDEVGAAADLRVRVPIHGRAESLNLAAAAAVCLYASARAARPVPAPPPGHGPAGVASAR